ncbi:MAG: hypothetical protein Q8R76_11500 [Candidatus Omnitrophota bacterium]|nr:hypothetical protein [Candidatus Omnitrophota bacterium]
MKPVQIDRFFKRLDAHLDRAADVILTGAGAASLMGHVRPSMDIDFEIRLRTRRTPEVRRALVEAIESARKDAGVAVNYSEDISGWSMISYLDYRKKARRYKRIGKINIKTMAPAYWTIGKMVRFLDLDVKDMLKIIKSKKLRAGPLIRLWALAMDRSRISLRLGQFRRNVMIFVQTYGRQLWGKSTDVKKLLKDW